MNIELNCTKSVVATCGESNPLHLATMQSRKWVLMLIDMCPSGASEPTVVYEERLFVDEH